MTQIMNFKKLEVTGATKEEAIAKAPFDVMGDATQAYKNWAKKQTNGITESDKKQFMLDYLAKKSKNVHGVGFVITQEAAVADTRERPYRIEDIKNTSGARKYVLNFQLTNPDTDEVLASAEAEYVQAKDKNGLLVTNEDGTPKMVWKSKTKTQAKELAKDLYKNGYKGNIVCTYTKQVVNGEPIAFKAYYTPSKSTRTGVYTVFGIERD